ncbi:hypothetical protein CAL29_00740 [Bordetella genomosp. 10]|uniref:Uncharacterized protein n=1 Tax=Bordetella genomosp. 10 TaxID=1416804 RepID=A0A261SJS0_9BORD|nr:hypothetical protein [Bordetella genomosp. 10]OZI37000.1 hypothetical protein CAL29_00740 [Bordetella genomosp. 10]
MQALTSHLSLASAAGGGLARWRGAIARGNRAFEQADYRQALARYRTALAQAEALLGACDDIDGALAAFVVAHHNLADTWLRLGRDDERGEHLAAAHEALHRMMADDAMPPAWREAALRHSRVSHAELVRFLAACPGHARARAAHALNAAAAFQEQGPH